MTTPEPLDSAQHDSTRDRMVQVAGELFAEKGFKDTTIRDICSQAGVNVAAVNYHFRDKEGLYREVLRLMFVEGATKFPPLQGVNEDAAPEQKLEAFILSMLRRLFDEGKPAWKMKLMAQEMSNPSPAMQAVIEEGVRPMFNLLMGITREIVGETVPENVVKHAATSVVAQCIHYHHARPIITQLGHWDLSTDADRVVLSRQLTEFSLGGLSRIRTVYGVGASKE
jgi:AcrR family transcriptional regulator